METIEHNGRTYQVEHIRVAHAVSRRGGTQYRARAFAMVRIGALPELVINCPTIAIEDTAEAAEACAVEYLRDIFRREGSEAPDTVISYGRLPSWRVDNLSFGVKEDLSQ